MINRRDGLIIRVAPERGVIWVERDTTLPSLEEVLADM